MILILVSFLNNTMVMCLLDFFIENLNILRGLTIFFDIEWALLGVVALTIIGITINKIVRGFEDDDDSDNFPHLGDLADFDGVNKKTENGLKGSVNSNTLVFCVFLYVIVLGLYLL